MRQMISLILPEEFLYAAGIKHLQMKFLMEAKIRLRSVCAFSECLELNFSLINSFSKIIGFGSSKWMIFRNDDYRDKNNL